MPSSPTARRHPWRPPARKGGQRPKAGPGLAWPSRPGSGARCPPQGGPLRWSGPPRRGRGPAGGPGRVLIPQDGLPPPPQWEPGSLSSRPAFVGGKPGCSPRAAFLPLTPAARLLPCRLALHLGGLSEEKGAFLQPLPACPPTPTPRALHGPAAGFHFSAGIAGSAGWLVKLLCTRGKYCYKEMRAIEGVLQGCAVGRRGLEVPSE